MRTLAVLGLMLATACGPITYVNQVTRKASREVDAARSAQADTLAPYHFTLAVEYLEKAREEAAHADFAAANRLGKKAAEAARQAIAVALSNAREQEAGPPLSPAGGGPP
jgi:lipopolysaccharide biosynthesis regulator YciM